MSKLTHDTVRDILSKFVHKISIVKICLKALLKQAYCKIVFLLMKMFHRCYYKSNEAQVSFELCNVLRKMFMNNSHNYFKVPSYTLIISKTKQ